MPLGADTCPDPCPRLWNLELLCAEALEGALHAEADFIRWKTCVSAGKPKSDEAAKAVPKWNPSTQDMRAVMQTLDDSASRLRLQRKRGESRHATQDKTMFSNHFGFHLEGCEPLGMEGLGGGEDEGRVFDAPLRVPLPAPAPPTPLHAGRVSWHPPSPQHGVMPLSPCRRT